MKKYQPRVRRHLRVRKTIFGTAQKPRLAVFRSNQHIYAQIIDDNQQKTLVAASDLKISNAKKTEVAFEVGKNIAKDAIKKGIKLVVFDRGGFLYHGRVAKLAEGAREGGLTF
ncbi:50S ribosomal protein L18 [Patescibacteria group bacterium]|nr:50S ribosomal protein L18 [Patescibacteria group bacterium]MCL5409340.1 50S ribosomal protein L18 [Patescibacteria group bacterium]